MRNKCTILVNSCDDFSDVWELFFKAFETQWADCPYPIILNTETKKFCGKSNIKTVNFHPKEKDCWGKRYKNALKGIETDYVIPLLEDFVLSEPFIGQKVIEDVIEYMEANPEIGVFYIHKHPNVIQEKTEFDGFGLMPKECDYKLTTQPAVWRKSFLDKCIKGIESPWEWELYATKRAWRFDEKMYALLDTEEEIFKFPWGGVIWRGLWTSEVIPLANKYNIDIDFNIRGFMDENNPYRIPEPYSFKKNFIKGFYSRTYWKKAFNVIILPRWRRFVCEL